MRDHRAAHQSAPYQVAPTVLLAGKGSSPISTSGFAVYSEFFSMLGVPFHYGRAWVAARADIFRYCQTENFLIVSGGIGLDAVLALTLNLWQMQHYPLPRLPLTCLPMGAVVAGSAGGARAGAACCCGASGIGSEGWISDINETRVLARVTEQKVIQTYVRIQL